MPMPLKLSDPVSECRRRAADYGRRARTAIETERFLEMERRRFSLARSREYAERLGRFTGTRRRGGEPEE
jgi:hypothetical protein